jgi:hypothetical protein
MNVQMMLCVNNRNGQHTGRVERVDIVCDGADCIISAEGDPVPCQPGYPCQSFNIGDVRVKCLRYGTYVGNIFWDCAVVSIEYVVKALNYLASQHWTLLEADTRLWDKWGALTERDLCEVME